MRFVVLLPLWLILLLLPLLVVAWLHLVAARLVWSGVRLTVRAVRRRTSI